MKTVSIHDAKTNLSKYIVAVKKGEKIFIGGFGRPEVQLVRVSADETMLRPRQFAIAKGKITATADAFTQQTDKEVAALLFSDTKQ